MSAIQPHLATNMRTLIEANIIYEATHNWPDADKVAGVEFLKFPHRHLFYVRLRKLVTHDDRDVEFIDWGRQIKDYLEYTYQKDFGSQSCEMIGKELLKKFDCEEVRVMEDNENGAVVYKD